FIFSHFRPTFVALLTRYNRYILPILTAKIPISRLIFSYIMDTLHRQYRRQTAKMAVRFYIMDTLHRQYRRQTAKMAVRFCPILPLFFAPFRRSFLPTFAVYFPPVSSAAFILKTGKNY
ncbi:MAG: hypothetical protein JXD22_00145, partial [Sedimentisphaerales bacterium]|nr:hypothetical protein [Sedimentisphaerales bacterium]